MFNRKSKVKFMSPYIGQYIPLDSVNDPVFSSKAMGDGFAVKLTDGKVVSPVDGKITMCFPTSHAFGITDQSGVEYLLHIGIDTVSLNGEGFTPRVKQGDKVKVGSIICDVDIKSIRDKGIDITSMCIITNREIEIISEPDTSTNVIDFIKIY